MDSDCVVLGFVSGDDDDSPKLKLFDFERVFVSAGEAVNVTLSVSPESISLVNEKGVERIVPGGYRVMLGDYQSREAGGRFVETRLELVGEEEVLFDLERIKKEYYAKQR